VLVQPNRPNSTQHVPLDRTAVAQLGKQPYVQSAWGEVVVTGVLSAPTVPNVASPTVLYSLPPHEQLQATGIVLAAGRMPGSNTISEGVISAEEAKRLGLAPDQAVGRRVVFLGQYPGRPAVGPPAAKPVQMAVTVVGGRWSDRIGRRKIFVVWSGVVTGVISRSKNPFFWASTARCWDRNANSSISTRVTPSCSRTFSAVCPIAM